MAQSTHLQSIKFGDNNANCGNTVGSYNKTVYKSDEDAQIARWLSPLEPNNRHQGVRTDRFDGVGDWFLETIEFRQWRDSDVGADKAVLFCSGNPGVGKTYLSSLVIDSLCDQIGGGDIAVTALYYDFSAQQEQTIINVMGSILKQLVGRGIPKYIREAFQKGKGELGGRGLRLADLMGMLRTAIASLSQVFICIDALDECLPKHLPELLKSLRDIVRESPTTRIFLTGRPHVREDILRYLTKVIVIPISPNKDDIRNYLEMRLAGDADPEAMSDDLRADIVRVILEKTSDIFLLVSINVDAILGEVTVRQRRKKLEEMERGNGLSDAYTATLTRLKAQARHKSTLGLKVLMWVLCSQRPLQTEELRHALGVEMGSADLDPENLPALRTLLASCLGLVTVEASSSTVRLVHFTLREHLSSDPTLFHSPHSTIAEVCLTYLNFGRVRDLPPNLYSAPTTMPLLEYASYYWGEHTRRGMTENAKLLALRLLDRFDEHISARLLLLRYNRDSMRRPYFFGLGDPAGFTGLHGVAFLGIAEIVAAVLGMREWDVNAADCWGSTALIWATRRGQDEVVKVLLEREDIDPNIADTWYGRTPLTLAAENGDEGLLKILLERQDSNPNTADTQYGRTPLSWAAWRGHEEVVRVLLELEGIDPNTPDTQGGRTPLSLAAEKGHEGVVKILLERQDTNPNTSDTQYGRMPLSWAAWNGHEEVARVLSEREDIDPNTQDTQGGRTPLSLAAEKGHEGIVKILLERQGINPNTADTKYGRTPLWWAAKRGCRGVVKILLEREDTNPNAADTQGGRTPLSLAAEKGHEGIVKILLERQGINPNTADTKYGRTPLWWAAWCRNEEVGKMLLEREDVNPNQADTQCGRTPLSLAAECRHEGTVKMLLERQDTNPNTADTKYGRTPLSWAARRGDEEIVKMLLEREDVNPNQVDTQCGRTPLSLAADYGHEEVVKMLLGRGDTNPNMTDTKYGRTPLSLAAQYGHQGIVTMLSEREDVDANTADTIYGRTPLSLAAEYGHERVVKILLEREDINLDTADTKYGRKPLSWAAECGHKGVVKVLLERKNVRTAARDSKNQTPLSLALSKGRGGAVRILLEQDNVDCDTGGGSGQASFPPSSRYGGERVADMGFRDDGPNTDTANLDGQPSLKKRRVEKQAVERSVAGEPKKNSILKGEQVGERLKDLIINHRKGLQNMCGQTEAELGKCLEVPTKRGEEMARKLIMMGCNIEVAKNLTLLTLYDLAILIDDSDFVVSEDDRERKETLIQFVDHITELYSMANESGIFAMHLMNSGGGKKNWKGKSQDHLRHNYGGVRRIGTALKRRILDKYAIRKYDQKKPLLVLIITNGAVEGERKGHLENVIRDCVTEREGAGKGRDAVSFQFSRIGNDPGAAELLQGLDRNESLRKHIDVLPVEFDPKFLLAEKWFVLPKILLGAILPDWNKQDDHSRIRIKDRLADKEKEKDCPADKEKDAEESDPGDDWVE